MSKYLFMAKRNKSGPRWSRRFSLIQKRTVMPIFNQGAFKIILGVFIISLFLGYLIQVNALATKGYQIKELEKKLNELNQASADLELEALSLQSMTQVKEKVEHLGMVTVSESDYLSMTPVAIAR
ncbi:MAG: hypothetical protein A2729_04390 [Candidatus Buchananbacteria bacterium RIFCSPHIGHO2_01_FULL_39_14]|uniref:Cell division protein FtsL n=2 Tax=Candidatus Buchananiibacteriota TaxID=1817903 RepID=A0A1G1YPK5_9BACT|nr:MAG: hypothetical protein A2729_04390 [Candidatus Buchananbacteria bacterium RIFCSPHIGHO2_01_FULL_39_14]OGY49661.1 MAG: hypothetical protein A3D39_00875 [Candidatus Buchananbacteria bacterium RIFCSPHIGHO2_02_FULL_39_17]OGY54292.1 MAG: hypothetical protein A2912_04615 [Candidatus Buchananbacteria bacterium RIFCSPLOWO2_01_FULL_40_23b]